MRLKELTKHMDPSTTRSKPPNEFTTSTEQRLSEMVAHALGVPSVARDDDFLQLGGHSLVAMRVATRVLEEFGVAMELEEFFSPSATIRRLADSIESRQAVGHMPPRE